MTKPPHSSLCVYHDLLQSSPSDGMRELVIHLRGIRDSRSEPEWTKFIKDARSTSLLEVLHRDPFTFRSFSKPRGYAGDAVMLDMIYQHEDVCEANNIELGNAIYRFTTNSDASHAVRVRRDKIAEIITGTAQNNPHATILSVACGHMRELEKIDNIRNCRVTALDSDPQSLQTIVEDYRSLQITPLALSVKTILSADVAGAIGTNYDLIYSAGLFDYFSQRMAEKITSALFARLKQGGRLVIANFSHGLRDSGYMECFMDWWLTYRNEADMERLTSRISDIKLKTKWCIVMRVAVCCM